MVKGRRGFTLIELLVVIAIIAILAAILFPVFAKARAKARQAACLSNMNQIAKAFMMYAQDYDEAFPYPGCSYGGNLSWALRLMPYVKNAQVYKCPEVNARAPSPDLGKQVCSYEENVNIVGDSESPYGYGIGFFKLSSIIRPANVVMFNEGNVDEYCRDGIARSWFLMENSNWINVYWTEPKHNDGFIVGFCDGHVKWYGVSKDECIDRGGGYYIFYTSAQVWKDTTFDPMWDG